MTSHSKWLKIILFHVLINFAKQISGVAKSQTKQNSRLLLENNQQNTNNYSKHIQH